jgi:hypothetical protein
MCSSGRYNTLLIEAQPEKSTSRKFRLIGESYVHGVRRGEATIGYVKGRQKLLPFEIM